MAFDLSVLPALLRRDIEEGERHVPAIPAEMPPAVAADPGWTRQWLAAKARLEQGWTDTTEAWDAGRRRTLGRYLAVTGYVELELIVGGCAHAVAHYEMPAAWRACLVKQAYQDMEHAASYITRGCRWSGEDYWRGIDLPYRRHVEARSPILHRDLGGFFAVIGLHTEAYPAQTNILDALMLDPVLARWTPHEIEEEAGHLGFLYPAMREYLTTGPPEQQDRRKRQLVADNEELLATWLEFNRKNNEEFLVGRLGLDPAVLDVYAGVPERTRFIYRTIGIDESYWPAYLKARV